jgi:hypothetical protein
MERLCDQPSHDETKHETIEIKLRNGHFYEKSLSNKHTWRCLRTPIRRADLLKPFVIICIQFKINFYLKI